MNWAARRARFRAVLEGPRCVYPGSVFDPISARIAADIGFEVGMFAGSTASLTVLGAPDLIVLTLTEFAQQAYRINRAGGLPVMVDADHGYGNALNVRRTVEELESAGVVGMTIEDTVLPVPFGEVGTTRLISVAEGIGKMKAALDARQDPSLVIIGRTSAVAVTGVEDAIARVRAYEAAGVDAVFLVGVRTRAELEPVAASVKVPVMLGTATPELMDLDYLSGLGVRICLQGHAPIMAAAQAVHDTLLALRNDAKPSGVAPPEMMQRVTRDRDYQAWMKAFLTDSKA